MKKWMIVAMFAAGVVAACHQKEQTKTGENMTKLNLVQEWDKVFPLSDKVNHSKVTFETQYGLTLAADMYTPKDGQAKMPAIAVSGPFGAVKEQSSGLYAMRMAERASQLRLPGWEASLERSWQPTPVFLPGEAHEQRSLAVYGP